MTDRPSPAHRPARSRRMTRDQAAMLVVTISVCTILGAMGALAIMVLPGDTAEPDVLAVEPTESASDEPEQALEYSAIEVVDPESFEGVAALWYEAQFNSDLATLESHTCANPTTAVTVSLQDAAADEVTDVGYTASNIFVTSREYNGYHEVAIFVRASEATYDYIWEKESRPDDVIVIMTVVDEGGEWKVCGFEAFT